jgi:ubiquinone/menaquinone biosynthesis C-methylase UbiE/pimeloyl-ACP methyl ester carboxylesterase
MAANVACHFCCDGAELGPLSLIDLSASGFAATVPPELDIPQGSILETFELLVSDQVVWSGEAVVAYSTEDRIGGRFTSELLDLEQLRLGATLEGRPNAQPRESERVVASTLLPTPRLRASTGPPPPQGALASRVGILTTDDSLKLYLEHMCAGLGLQATTEPEGFVAVIDPRVGASAIRDWAPRASAAAVIRNEASAGEVLVALRLSRGTLVEDPRAAPDTLRAHLTETLLLEAGRRDRRTYPRAPGSAITLVEPAGAELVDISPYGARVRIAHSSEPVAILRLRVQLEQHGLADEIHCQVVERIEGPELDELRLRFAKLQTETQAELLRISKAHIFCQTITDTHAQCETGDVEGFRRVVVLWQLLQVLTQFAKERAAVRFAHMSRGRLQTGNIVGFDQDSRVITIGLAESGALGETGDRVCYSVAANNGAWLLDGHLLRQSATEVTLTFPSACVAAEHRAQNRLFLGPSSGLRVHLLGHGYPVTDISSRGFSFLVSETDPWIAPAATADVSFTLRDGTEHEEHALVRNVRAASNGHVVGCTFAQPRAKQVDTPPPIVREDLTALSVNVKHVDHGYDSEKVTFPSASGRRVVGFWTQTQSKGGKPYVIVVPPAWAKTKESMTLLAQFLCATFDEHGRELAVLRIDYTNALGESERSPEFQAAGHETLGLTMSECVKDIHGAIAYATSRSLEADIALIGMSFSGPLALRAAVEDRRVGVLFELMGASDVQDLVRRATGGVDYANRYRAGVRTGLQNVLGILSDTDRWVSDGIRSELMYLQSAQADAAKLDIPIVWIHGLHDAFVSEERIQSVLAFAGSPERKLIVVPCGHVPTKTMEAIRSYVPIAAHLLRRDGEQPATFAAPHDAMVAREAEKEWREAPRARLPSPRDYWRDYMLGKSEASIGFDVLTMTREYRQLMHLQTGLLELGANDELHDVGAGLGHSLSYLRSGSRVRLYDFVPELLEQARKRASGLEIHADTTEWDADHAAVPQTLSQATHVLMSLFLSCLTNPRAVLLKLAAALRPGTRVVASTIRPDADLSGVYAGLLRDITSGEVPPQPEYTIEQLVDGVREYMSSAAWLLRLADEGTFHFFDEAEFVEMFREVGFEVVSIHHAFGSPERALVLVGERGKKP